MHSLTQLLDPVSWIATLGDSWNALDRTAFWVALVQIIWVNILLSGDNAVVIAIACRDLPTRQRVWGVILGSGIAVLLRIVFTAAIASLLLLPYVKIIGGLALLYVAAKLTVPDDPDSDATAAPSHLWRAVRIIAVADLIMSLDNVIAIAAAANGNVLLLILGLAISIPLIVAGSALIISLLDRFPLVVWAGAALLGWIAGEVIATDPVVAGALTGHFGAAAAHQAALGAAAFGAVLVLAGGALWRRIKVQGGSGA